jgi:hemolysin D
MGVPNARLYYECSLNSLIPGMEVTAELKTGERSLIECYLAPLLRHGQESLRER